ncbi:MAG TPA: hypothetical protein VF166_10485 [Gemmatimonadaceae bacterium]
MTLRRVLSIVSVLVPTALSAQGVLVAPTGIFIDPRTHGGSVELYNPGSEQVEVSISTAFGYPVSDSLGRVTLHLENAPDSTAPSAASWIDAFPRRLVVPAHERRTVRLLARPPMHLPDGEYWARLIVDAKGRRIALQTPDDSAGLHIGLTLDVRTIVAVFYRAGRVHTGVTMADTRARLARDSVDVCARFTRGGNAAFLGALHLTLARNAGARAMTLSVPLAVYGTLSPCVAMAAAALAPGRYVVRLLVDTDRGDLQRSALLPIAALRDSVMFTVPAPR